MNRPSRLAWLGLVLSVGLCLEACTSPGITVGTGPQETTISGRFAGEPMGDAGCAWIEASGAQRIEVAYPNGWHVQFDPLLLVDDAGQQRARGGDTLSVKGYFLAVGASLCQPDRMFVATEVTVSP